MNIRTKIKLTLGITLVAVSISFAATGIPEHFQGTWTIDYAATESLWNAWGEESGRQSSLKRRLQRMKAENARLKFTGNEIIFENDDGDRDVDPVTVVEVTEQFLILSMDGSPERQMRLSLEGTEAMILSAVSGAEPPVKLVRGGSSGDGSSREKGADRVAYLDALAHCTAGTFSVVMSGGRSIDNIVDGREGNRCVVRTRMQGREILCRYSSETIALLTSPEKYEDARTGVVRGSTDSEESRRVSQECAASD